MKRLKRYAANNPDDVSPHTTAKRLKNFAQKMFTLLVVPQSFFHLRSHGSGMQSIDGYIDYTRREYCHDISCPIQKLLDKEVEKSPGYEEIRAICATNCLHSTHEFHRWLIDMGYLIVRPKEE